MRSVNCILRVTGLSPFLTTARKHFRRHFRAVRKIKVFVFHCLKALPVSLRFLECANFLHFRCFVTQLLGIPNIIRLIHTQLHTKAANVVLPVAVVVDGEIKAAFANAGFV